MRKTKEVVPDVLQADCLDSMYVYLCSGDCVEVSFTEELKVESLDIVLSADGAPIASFPRAEVYFCSRKLISPPILF